MAITLASDCAPDAASACPILPVCLRSGLQAAVTVGGGTVGVVLIPGLAGGQTNSDGGGVEQSKAGDNKEKLAKDVSGEIEGGIGVVKGASKY
jgi:hypothetical protein